MVRVGKGANSTWFVLKYYQKKGKEKAKKKIKMGSREWYFTYQALEDTNGDDTEYMYVNVYVI